MLSSSRSPLPITFSFLSGFHLFPFYLHRFLCLSGSPFIILSYLAMSSDTSALLPASVYSHPALLLSLLFLCSSLHPGLSALPSPSLHLSLLPFLSVPISLSSTLCSVTLPEQLKRTHTHSYAHTYSYSRSLPVTESHPGAAQLRLAGLFELRGAALRDCVYNCARDMCGAHSRTRTLAGVCVCVRVCAGDGECLQKCEIEDLRQMNLSRGCNFKAQNPQLSARCSRGGSDREPRPLPPPHN